MHLLPVRHAEFRVAFFVANGVFIYLALNNNPGLVVDDYYERGQDYEKNMLKRMAAERLGQSRGRMTRKQLSNIFPLRREADFESMAQELAEAGVLGA